MRKVKSVSYLRKLVRFLHKKGKTTVFTNGCFDILHPGHLKILRSARSKGDVLIVGLNSDSSVKKIKGKRRPVFSQDFRARILEALDCVDYIVIFDEKTPYNLLKLIKPEILVKGGDWDSSKIIGKDLVKKVYRVKLCPGYSTTSLIKKIKNSV